MTVMAEKTPRAKGDRIVLHIRINSELRQGLKLAAYSEGLTMEEKLHAILCRELDREDLYLQAPDAAPAKQRR